MQLLRHVVPTHVVGSGAGRRTQGVNRTSYRAGNGFALSSFFLGFNDLGAGQVDITPGRGGVSGTFTRATTAWTQLASGLWTQVASGTPRSYYSAGTYLGYLAEGARTNELLWARDLSNAAWVKSNTTAAADQVGIDGVGNSASSLTATAGNGTCLQTVTEAAATREFSAFVKRITGTGEIDMTEDGGLTWTDVTASITAAGYTQVAAASQSVLNPAIGFRIVTNGDKIAVDMAQNEAGAFASTPIPTTTVAVTRNADVLTYPTSPWLNASAGTLYGQFQVFQTPFVTGVVANISDGTQNERYDISYHAGPGRFLAVDGGVVQANLDTANSVTANITAKLSGVYAANDFASCLNGGTVATDASGTLPTVTTLQIGNDSAGVSALFGPIRRVQYFNQRLPDAMLQALTS